MLQIYIKIPTSVPVYTYLLQVSGTTKPEIADFIALDFWLRCMVQSSEVSVFSIAYFVSLGFILR